MTTDKARGGFLERFLPALFCLAGGSSLALIVADLAAQADGGFSAQAQARLAASGIASPVTAVLLNFRAYDTLLEIGVLLLAVIGLSSLRERNVNPLPAERMDDPVLSALVRLLFPLAVLTAGYLLWSGTHAPGGAFQAGAVLGAGGVLLHLAGFTVPAGLRGGLLRGLFLLGFCVFLTVAAGVMIPGNRFLEYPPGGARELIVLIESALTVSIAFILSGLVLISSPPQPHDHALPSVRGDKP